MEDVILLSKDFFNKEYINKKKSINTISRELEIDRTVVIRYLKKNKIITRSIKEQKNIDNPPKEFILSEKNMAFIHGLLLGDASVPNRKNKIQPRSFTQACKHEEYLRYILNRLRSYGIICSPILSRWIKDDRCKNGGYDQHFLQTRRYKTFEYFRDKFYPKGIKIIPKDIIITKDLLLQLYLCDGNFYRHITLCVNAFTKEDIVFLKDLIDKKLNINLSLKKQKNQFMLVIKKLDCNKFLKYIGESPVDCYKYKWEDNESEALKERKRLKARERYVLSKNAR